MPRSISRRRKERLLRAAGRMKVQIALSSEVDEDGIAAMEACERVLRAEADFRKDAYKIAKEKGILLSNRKMLEDLK